MMNNNSNMDDVCALKGKDSVYFMIFPGSWDLEDSFSLARRYVDFKKWIDENRGYMSIAEQLKASDICHRWEKALKKKKIELDGNTIRKTL